MSDPLADRTRANLRTLVSVGRRHGVPETDLLAGTGLHPSDLSDPRRDPQPEHEYQAIRNLLARTDPSLALPLEAGLDFHLANIKAWGTAMITSSVLGEAIAFSLGYAESLPTQVNVTAEVTDGVFTMVLLDDHLPEDVRVFVTLRTMVAFAMTGRELLGRPIPLLAVSGRAERPRYAAEVDAFCGVEVVWDAPATSYAMDATWLAAPLPSADQRAHRHAVEECHRHLEQHRARGGVAAQVREVIAARPTNPGVDDVARRVGLSPRSLRRRLSEEGTSFRSLVAMERLRLADEALAAGRSVEETSRLLGYSEPAAFSHAFKRWAGVSPDAYRRVPDGAPRR